MESEQTERARQITEQFINLAEQYKQVTGQAVYRITFDWPRTFVGTGSRPYAADIAALYED